MAPNDELVAPALGLRSKASMNARPVRKPERLTDLAYERLRDALMAGDVQPGEVVSIVKLSEALDVSRSPVRAAAERMIVEGLLAWRGSNLIVRVMSKKELIDALELRAPLERLAVQKACANLASPEIANLKEWYEQFAAAVAEHDSRRARVVDLRFHQAIQRHADSPILDEHLRLVQSRVILATHSIAWSARQQLAVQEHRVILDLLIAKESTAAGEAAYDHVMATRRRISEDWNDQRGAFDAVSTA